MKDKTTYVFLVEKLRPLQDLVGVLPEYITIQTPASDPQLVKDAVIQKLQDAVEYATLYKPSLTLQEVVMTQSLFNRKP